ncbi:hypothetical protein P7C71_g117, partial [Lecanoromycetidae sp. Uapishka_2]
MPGFADSFWSGDYAGGLGVLFGKLQQGVIENQQVLTIAKMRADAEEMYGKRLGDIAPTTDRMTGGFARDDGASLRKAYEGVRGEMEEAAKNHKKIASNISELVVIPFSRWCEAHESRVQNSQDDLQARMKAHDKQGDYVKKLRSAYFNKCRQLEDLDEEDKLAFQSPEKDLTSPKSAATPIIKLPESQEPDDDDPIEIGDETYEPEQVKKILMHVLSTIKVSEAKVPILGTYQNVSTGADITDYIQRHMGATSVSYAERVGQDLVTHGFLRLIGNVGSTFANSSKMNYQWRPKVFQITGIPEKKKSLDRVSSIASSSDSNSLVSSQVYEIIKTIYSTPDSSTSPKTRISVLQNTLGQLRLANIATLDALTTHFTRLIELTSADEAFVAALATNIAPCILRPRNDTAVTMHEKHAYRLIRDLFDHKEEIFGELKRASILSHTPSGGDRSNAARIRAISTDESHRRANMEARNRAIASKSRNSSPAPQANGRSHRRDRSSDPPATRFPVATSSPSTGEAAPRRGPVRASLEVPSDEGGSPVVERSSKTSNVSSMINNLNNNSKTIPEDAPPSPNPNHDMYTAPLPSSEDTNGTFSEKRESLGRGSRFPPRKPGNTGSLGRNRTSVESENGIGERQGVQLSDKPMDD